MLDIGQFSRLARVSKRTLRYYDTIDLFKPIHTIPSGARYYSARQFADLNRILALKELGMSLAQIERMLAEDVSQEEIRGMLLIKKAETEQALLDEIQRFRSIEARLQSPDHYLTEGIVLTTVPEQHFLSIRTVLNPQTVMSFTMQIMQEVPKVVGHDRVGHYTTLMHWDAYDMEHMDAEVGFLLPRPLGHSVELGPNLILTERVLPPLEMAASAVLVGGPSRYPAGFNAVGRWAEEHRFEVGEPQREIFLAFSPSLVEEDMVIELQFPLTRQLPDPRSLLTA